MGLCNGGMAADTTERERFRFQLPDRDCWHETLMEMTRCHACRDQAIAFVRKAGFWTEDDLVLGRLLVGR